MGKLEKIVLAGVLAASSPENVDAQKEKISDEDTSKKVEVVDKVKDEAVNSKEVIAFEDAVTQLETAYNSKISVDENAVENMNIYSERVIPAESIEEGRFDKVLISKNNIEFKQLLEFQEREIFIIPLPDGELFSDSEIEQYLNDGGYTLIGESAPHYLTGLARDLKERDQLLAEFLQCYDQTLFVHAVTGQDFEDLGSHKPGSLFASESLMCGTELKAGAHTEKEIGTEIKNSIHKNYVIAFKIEEL